MGSLGRFSSRQKRYQGLVQCLCGVCPLGNQIYAFLVPSKALLNLNTGVILDLVYLELILDMIHGASTHLRGRTSLNHRAHPSTLPRSRPRTSLQKTSDQHCFSGPLRCENYTPAVTYSMFLELLTFYSAFVPQDPVAVQAATVIEDIANRKYLSRLSESFYPPCGDKARITSSIFAIN